MDCMCLPRNELFQLFVAHRCQDEKTSFGIQSTLPSNKAQSGIQSSVVFKASSGRSSHSRRPICYSPNASRLAISTTVILIPVTLSTSFFRRSAISLTISSSARRSASRRCRSSSFADPLTAPDSIVFDFAALSDGEDGAGVGGMGTLTGSVASSNEPALDRLAGIVDAIPSLLSPPP